jgi:hypothetical protein
MKPLRAFSIISCFFVIFSFLIFLFHGISIADEKEEKRISECMDSCISNAKVCYNMTADPRRCEAIYNECVAACKPEGNTSRQGT